MLTIQSDHSAKVVLETDSDAVWAVAFNPDGKHVFGGTNDGIRRWRIANGQEVGKQTGKYVNAIAVSRDRKWVVFGTWEGASVWDAELREKVVAVEDTADVRAVDVAPDCSRFATGTLSGKASVWSTRTGERLVGPPEHGGCVTGIRFSPDGGRIATACPGDSTIRIFDSHNGDQVVSIENPMPGGFPTTPIVWSADSQRLFVISTDHKLKSFVSSTGSQLAEWQVHENDSPGQGDDMSIALSPNNKFISSSAGRYVSFWDTSTEMQLGIVKETSEIQSIALSPDGSCLASGSYTSGTINIWDLRGIVPESYLPIKVSIIFLGQAKHSLVVFLSVCT